MGKITGKETREQLPEKVLLMYQAVQELIEEETDIINLTVSDITQRAGIGKGTAYEYFDSKDEIIVNAIFYNIEQTMSVFRERLMQKSTFRDKVEYIFEEVKQKTGARNCILKYVNLLFDSTQTGNLLRSRMECAAREECPPLILGYEIVKEGIHNGELRDDLPISYMAYILVTKILSYMAYLAKGKNEEVTEEQFTQCILDGILEEFEKRN